ncbi:hypothetical protein ACTFIW_012770 [Dictyostelium discoideum]
MLNKEALYTSLKVVYGLALVATPIWGTGVLLATLMMNDSGRFKNRFQYGCLSSFVATPIALTFSLYRLHYGDRRPLVALLPFITVSSYITCCFAFWKDKK